MGASTQCQSLESVREGDGLTAVHDALRSSHAIVSERTMDRLHDRVSRTSEAEALRVRALEEDVLDLAERLVRFRTERQRVSAERSQDTQRLEEALTRIAETERSAEKEAEAAVISAVMGMHGAVGRSLIDEARRRDDGNHALQIESNAATALLRDAVHAHAAASASSAQKLQTEQLAKIRELEDMLAQVTATRKAAHARLSKTIQDAVGKVEAELAAERAARRSRCVFIQCQACAMFAHNLRMEEN